MSNKQIQTVNFETGNPEGDALHISLDDDYNALVYGPSQVSPVVTTLFQGTSSGAVSSDSINQDADFQKTVFDSKEIAYLKIIGDFDPTTLSASVGTVAIQNSLVLYPQEEVLTFVCCSEVNLSFTPYSAVTWEWVGKGGGNPVFIGNRVLVPSNISGVLKVSYSVGGKRIALSNAVLPNLEYEVLVSVCLPEKASTTVNFKNVEATEGSLTLKVLVKDICSGNPIPNAVVSIPGIGSGTTDLKGYLLFPGAKVSPGQTCSIKVSASGYLPTNEDNVANDTFVVPTPQASDPSIGSETGLGTDVSCPYLQLSVQQLKSGIFFG